MALTRKYSIFHWNRFAFIHNGRFKIIEVIESLILKDRFLWNLSWFIFHRDIFECEEIWDVRWVEKNQFCTGVVTPVHLKSTKSVQLLEIMIPSLPSRNLLSQKLDSWNDVCLLVQLTDARNIGFFFFQMSAFRVKVTRTVQM